MKRQVWDESPGEILDKICLFLPKAVFSHGQPYVALSRVQSLESLSVVSEPSEIVNSAYSEVYD